MIIEAEDRFCKVAKAFSKALEKLERAAERGGAVHEVEEMAWGDLIEVGREMIVGYIQKQEEELPRPKVIEREGKKLRRLPKRRRRPYVSAFGPTPFERDVYAARETQRQELAPLDAKLGMPEGNMSYLLQKWSGAKCVKESYQESRAALREILGFAPSVNCLEDMAARAADHAEVFFDEQEPVDPTAEEQILVATSDCKGVPMRGIDAPRTKRGDDAPRVKRKRLKKGEKNGQKRMACVGGVYSVAPFRRTADDVLDEILRKEKQSQRPKPQNKRLRAVLTREVDGKEVNAKDVVFDWLAKEVRQRDPQERRTVVAVMDGETKLRDLQELKIGRAIGVLDIWRVTEYLWKLAYCFHAEGSDAAEAFVETYLRKLLAGKVARVIGGIRQMTTKRRLSKHKREKARQRLHYFAQRCECMKYDEYLAAGYPIGSGVVEGACRHLVKDRMEQTGMRWRIAGAQAVLSLRAIYVNNDWDTFHADRIQAEQRRLYPYKKRLHAILARPRFARPQPKQSVGLQKGRSSWMMVLSDNQHQENAVKRFTRQYNELVTGVLSCFDRILFKGHLPIGWGDSMEGLLARQGLRIKDFGKFVQKHSRRIAEHAERLAEKSGRPYLYLNGRHRKEAIVQGLIEAEGLQQGLVCVMRAVEPCQSFKVALGEGRPRLASAGRKCLCFYFYFLDPKLGLVHVRIQSWFPLMVQVCLNGHDVLARKLDKHGIAYRKVDNAFTWIEDTRRAQRFADRLVKMNWPRILTSLARRVNPLLKDLLAGMDYYWVADQAEYATDVMFKSPAALKPLYEKLVKRASTCFSAEDVLKFLGRKLHGNYQGEILSDYKKRWPGARVKHRAKGNWIKMYDKHGRVLRVETVINQPREFKVRRQGTRKGQKVIDWFPLCKGVANLFRYAEICRGANRRYLDALAAVEPPVEAMRDLRCLARSKRRKGRPHRGFNPLAQEDLRLFAALFRGEHTLHGMRNQDIRRHLFGETADRDLRRRQANKVSRLFRRLHVHGLLAKIPRSRRWRLTKRGALQISVFLECHYDKYPELLAPLAT